MIILIAIVYTISRALMATGQCALQSVAPPIICDLCTGKIRSASICAFWLAIPLGEGIGYVLGSTVAQATSWRWALRLTPCLLGLTSILLGIFLDEPERGKRREEILKYYYNSEGHRVLDTPDPVRSQKLSNIWLLSKPNATQPNSKQLALELDIVVTCSPPHPTTTTTHKLFSHF